MRRLVGTAAVLTTLVAAAVAALAVAPPADAACGEALHYRAQADRVPGPPPLAIGDSVMLGAAGDLAAAGFRVDARGCRMMSEGLEVLETYRQAAQLPPVVVVALGANWTIETEQVRAALRILGRERVLGLVAPREEAGGADPDADVVRAAGSTWPTRVAVLDWAQRSAGHPEYFWADGLHLTPAGAGAFTGLLREVHDFTGPLEVVWRRVWRPAGRDRLTD